MGSTYLIISYLMCSLWSLGPSLLSGVIQLIEAASLPRPTPQFCNSFYITLGGKEKHILRVQHVYTVTAFIPHGCLRLFILICPQKSQELSTCSSFIQRKFYYTVSLLMVSPFYHRGWPRVKNILGFPRGIKHRALQPGCPFAQRALQRGWQGREDQTLFRCDPSALGELSTGHPSLLSYEHTLFCKIEFIGNASNLRSVSVPDD